MTQLALFLSLRELAYLRSTGCKALWSLLANSAEEACFTPESRAYSAVLPNNPFHLLSRLPLLLTVKLHRVWWTPSPNAPSPFSLLPRTVRHLEYEVAPSRYSLPLHSECVPTWHVLLNVNFGSCFPELEILKVKVELSFTQATEESGTPAWVLTLPPSLTALSLANVGHLKTILLFIKGEIPAEAMKHEFSPPPKNLARASPRCPPYAPPFSFLLGLELCHQKHDIPLLTHLPPSLVHFKWTHFMEINDNSMEAAISAEQSSRVVVTNSQFRLVERALRPIESPRTATRSTLHSVHLSSSNNDSIQLLHSLKRLSALILPNISRTELLPVPKTLTRLEVPLLTIDLKDTSNPSLFHRLYETGTHLKEFQFQRLQLPAKVDEGMRKLITSVLDSVLVLSIQEAVTFDISFLPRGLRTFRAHTSVLGSITWDDYDLSQLPQGLTKLSCPQIKIDLGDVPLLPRSILFLKFTPVNGMVIGTSNLTPAMRLDGLPYDSITPTTQVLFGLPPLLRSLSIFGDLEFDSTFGAFLPRTLQRVDGDGTRDQHCIKIEDSNKSYLHSLGSWFGLTQAQYSREELLRRAISLFPPGCTCALLFLERSLIIRTEVDFSQLVPICPYTTMECRI